jgi:hypothetical protein
MNRSEPRGIDPAARSAPLKRVYPFAGMVTPPGTRNFFGCAKSSVMYQPASETSAEDRLRSSTALPEAFAAGNSSLTTTDDGEAGSSSPVPGEPPTNGLVRQWSERFQLSTEAYSLTMTSEKPWPRVAGYQLP